MKYTNKSLNKNEIILCQAILNPIIRIPYFVVTLCWWIYIFNAKLSEIFFINLLILAIGIVLVKDCFKICIMLDTTELCITNKRVIGKHGWLNTNTLDAPLNKINDINIKQSIIGKIFNFSNIIISTSSNKYYFYFIKNSESFKNQFNEIIFNTNRETKKYSNEDKYDKLAKIKKLLDENIITEDEFKIEKEKILKQ